MRRKLDTATPARRRPRVAATAGVAAITLLSAASGAVAANTTPQTARLLIPDGTSLSQAIGPGETRWFAFEVEAGRSYVVEAVDVNGDLAANAVGNMGVWDVAGPPNPPVDTDVDCALSLRDLPPGLSPTNNGRRCTVRVNAPDDATTNRRALYVSIDQGSGAGVNVRVRDSTMFGRWTTNGYDFHIEFDNTSSDQVCAQALLYRETGYTFSGGSWGDAFFNLNTYNLIIPPGGSKKVKVNSGTPVGGTLRGTLRILGCPGVGGYLPGSVHVSTYAFNPVTHTYLFFYNWQSHDGSGANSW